MNRIAYLTLSIIILCGTLANAQEKRVWTLKECIDYAIENNLNVKQMEQTRQRNEINLDNAKMQYLPTVSGSIGQSFNFGRSLTSYNTYANHNVQNTSFDVSAHMSLFEFGRAAQRREAQLNLDAAIADLENAKEDIGINVAQAYLQVLYAKELVEVDKKQLELSQSQLTQKEELLKQGRAAESDISEARSRVASDQMTLVKAENDYKMALLDLSQLLELSTPEGMEIAIPEYDLTSLDGMTSPEQIYAEALTSRNDIKAAMLREKSADEAITNAKAGHYPSLSLSAGIGTSYYSVSGSNFESSFGDQLDQNLNKYISLNLSIPIFSRFSVKNQVRSAKVEKVNTTIEIEQTKKTLYKEIQQAYYNALSASSTYESSVAAEQASRDALDVQTRKFEAGRSTQTAYNEALTSWSRSAAEMVQAKYELAFRIKILDYYRGAEIK